MEISDMNKRILALALAALAPAAAMAADSNVTIYGIIDYGFMTRGGFDGAGLKAHRTGVLNEFAGGISAGNRLGFKGSEDLGNGLKAIFEIEFGFLGDAVNGATFTKNRHSWVGLTGGFGTVLGGRVDGARYSFVGKYDPFKNQTVANAASVFGYTSNLGQADRADNAVVYVTPELFAGFKVLGAYTTSLLSQEGSLAAAGQNIKTGNSPLYAIAAMYDNGPISATLDYENLKVYGVSSNSKYDLYVAGASYDFGVAKLMGYYEHTKGKEAAQGIKGDGWMIGVSAPIGPFTVMASYVDGKDKSDFAKTGKGDKNDCKKFGIGAEYALSKRTSFYTTYARINEEDKATCAITAAGSVSASSTAGATNGQPAYGRSGFDLGMRHAF
jgi:predicted porin